MLQPWNEAVLSGILGLCVGDALGVPVEFATREALSRNPVRGMLSGGTYDQPAGTWSDDTSMTLCQMDSITACGKADWEDLAARFARWMNEGYLTARGEAFDVGNTTLRAILRMVQGTPALQCGGGNEWDCGNGSLMRILPLAFYLSRQQGGYELIEAASSVTHAHPRVIVACALYVRLAMGLLAGKPLALSWEEAARAVFTHYRTASPALRAAAQWYETQFYRTPVEYQELPEKEVNSGGYVIHSLDAALWCLFQTGSYEECVLRAVNLGADTDTTAAIAGGIAGLLYGLDAIPESWRAAIARRELVEGLCRDFAAALE